MLGGCLSPHYCFNPRPPFRAGATHRHSPVHTLPLVSILARPFERALPAVRFVSAEPLLFQSSPALSSGRYHGHVDPRCGLCCFNPRPPFRAGATYFSSWQLRSRDVSILARPFERALLRAVGKGGRIIDVSILARPFERALLVPHKWLSGHWRFNPRPPFRAGATSSNVAKPVVSSVSILARPFERALQLQPTTSI